MADTYDLRELLLDADKDLTTKQADALIVAMQAKPFVVAKALGWIGGLVECKFDSEGNVI